MSIESLSPEQQTAFKNALDAWRGLPLDPALGGVSQVPQWVMAYLLDDYDRLATVENRLLLSVRDNEVQKVMLEKAKKDADRAAEEMELRARQRVEAAERREREAVERLEAAMERERAKVREVAAAQ